MMTRADSKMKSIFSRLLRDRAGNFGLATAIIIPVVAATAGVAMDLNKMVQVRSALQDSADAAVLSAANALAKDNTMSDEETIELALKFMKAQFFNVVPSVARTAPPASGSGRSVGWRSRQCRANDRYDRQDLRSDAEQFLHVPTNGLTACSAGRKSPWA